ncbi:MAG: hypothetical protein QXX08_04340 [Candidatus Bathyarchaeia archaeon]
MRHAGRSVEKLGFSGRNQTEKRSAGATVSLVEGDLKSTLFNLMWTGSLRLVQNRLRKRLNGKIRAGYTTTTHLTGPEFSK